MNRAELSAATKRMNVAGMLTESADQSSKLANAEPVNYFRLPRNADSYGRIVVSFAVLGKSGHLDATVPPLYGVIEQPIDEEDQRIGNEIAEKMVRENHAQAEHQALRNGIFTEYGRLTAEAAVLDKLMVPKARVEFASARIAHMDGLLQSVEADSSLSQRSQDRVAAELHRARNYLHANYQ